MDLSEMQARLLRMQYRRERQRVWAGVATILVIGFAVVWALTH